MRLLCVQTVNIFSSIFSINDPNQERSKSTAKTAPTSYPGKLQGSVSDLNQSIHQGRNNSIIQANLPSICRPIDPLYRWPFR
jgi:hypothetical protein